VNVTGTYNTGVTWNISPANVGTLLNGVYTAPAIVTAPQLITITATSMADPTKSAISLITLMPRRAPGE
jgi:trimeric autotransporter adhesin